MSFNYKFLLEKKNRKFFKKYEILSSEKDNYTERNNRGYSIEYDIYDGDKIIVRNNMGI